MAETESSKKRQMAFVVMMFAPMISMMGIGELLGALRDPELRPWVYLVVAGDLLYIGGVGSFSLYGSRLVPYIEALFTFIGSLDPHLVWQPWQVVAGSIVIGTVLLIMGYRGFQLPESDNTEQTKQ